MHPVVYRDEELGCTGNDFLYTPGITLNREQIQLLGPHAASKAPEEEDEKCPSLIFKDSYFDIVKAK